jgi:hypothetical protein
MATSYVDRVTVDNSLYYIKDTISGYTTNTGTVTSITAGTGLSGGTISTSGTIALDVTVIDCGTSTTVTGT